MELITLLLLIRTGIVECQDKSSEVDQPYPMPVFILAFAAVLLLVVIILLVAFNLIEAHKRKNESAKSQHAEAEKENKRVLLAEMEALKFKLNSFSCEMQNIPRNMRLFSLSMRALYAEKALGTTSETAKKLNQIRNNTRKEALVYVNVILPVSTRVVRSIKDFFNLYESLDFNEWREYLPSILEDVRGYRQCCVTLVTLHQEIMVPLKKRQDEAKVLISELTGLTEELETKKGVLEESAISKEQWACHLLFIPGLNVTVAPLLKLSAASDTIKAVADGQQSKINRSAIIVISETMMPAISAFVTGLDAAAGFFKVVEDDIASFENTEQKMGLQQHLHYKIMKKQAAEIKQNCKEFYAMIPAIESDFKAIPEMPDDRNYVEQWLQKQQKNILSRYSAKITGQLVNMLGYFINTANDDLSIEDKKEI